MAEKIDRETAKSIIKKDEELEALEWFVNESEYIEAELANTPDCDYRRFL